MRKEPGELQSFVVQKTLELLVPNRDAYGFCVPWERRRPARGAEPHDGPLAGDDRGKLHHTGRAPASQCPRWTIISCQQRPRDGSDATLQAEDTDAHRGPHIKLHSCPGAPATGRREVVLHILPHGSLCEVADEDAGGLRGVEALALRRGARRPPCVAFEQRGARGLAAEGGLTNCREDYEPAASFLPCPKDLRGDPAAPAATPMSWSCCWIWSAASKLRSLRSASRFASSPSTSARRAPAPNRSSPHFVPRLHPCSPFPLASHGIAAIILHLYCKLHLEYQLRWLLHT